MRHLTMDKHYSIIDDEDFGETEPEWDELVNVLVRSDEKDYKRKTIERGTRKAFKAKTKGY